MAISNTYDTTNPGSAVSNFEDLSASVYRVVPEKTPITSLASRGKTTATFAEWTVDKLKTPSTMANGVSEGADVSSFSDQYENRARIGNYIQVWRDDWMVSKLQQAAASAGPADVANAKAKAMINVKLGIEYQIASAGDRQQETGTGSPYKTRGLGDWIDSAGPSDVPSDYRTPSGSIEADGANLTEAELQTIVQGVFSASGEVSNNTMVCGTTIRNKISGFTRVEGATTARNYTVFDKGSEKKLTYAVTFFDTDYGMLTLMNGNPDCMIDANSAFILNSDFYELLDYIPMGATDLEDQGGGQRGYVDCAMALCVKNPRAFGKIET